MLFEFVFLSEMIKCQDTVSIHFVIFLKHLLLLLTSVVHARNTELRTIKMPKIKYQMCTLFILSDIHYGGTITPMYRCICQCAILCTKSPKKEHFHQFKVSSESSLRRVDCVLLCKCGYCPCKPLPIIQYM